MRTVYAVQFQVAPKPDLATAWQRLLGPSR